MKLRKLTAFFMAAIISCSALGVPVAALDEGEPSTPIVVEEYNHHTNEVTTKTVYVDSTPDTSINTIESIQRNSNDSSIGTYGLIGTTDQRTKVSTTAAPYDGIAKLSFDYQNGLTDRLGTGFLISENVIVTAAHNIKNASSQWCTDLTVTIGNQTYDVERSIVTTSWTNNGFLVKDDYGIIILSEEVTDATIFTLSTSYSSTKSYTVAGYSYWNGATGLYKQSGTITSSTSNDGSSVYKYKLDTIGGQSGGPVYDSSLKVVGIHAYELGGTLVQIPGTNIYYRENCSNNMAVKITSSIKNFCESYI